MNASPTNAKEGNDDAWDAFIFGGEQIREVVGGDCNNPLIARGAFGEISLAVHRKVHNNSNNNKVLQQQQQQQSFLRLVAVKSLMKSRVMNTRSSSFTSSTSSNSDDPVVNELEALRVLNPHPNIAELVAVYHPSRHQNMLQGNTLCAAFDYCPVDLDMALAWRRRTLQPLLSMHVIQTIARDLFAALQHCHVHSILHRDVKPQNCLVSSTTGCLQLCDFGLALHLPKNDNSGDGTDASSSSSQYQYQQQQQQQQQQQDTRLCTLHYRPPEVLLGARACHASVDIYSAGLTIIEVLSGDGIRPLFPGNNDLSQLTYIFQALGTPTEQSWPTVTSLPDWGKLTFSPQRPMSWNDLVPRAVPSSLLMDFLQGSVCLDPAQRRSAAACLEHAWLQAPASATAVASTSSATTSTVKSPKSTTTARAHVISELIPPELREPLLLAPPPPSASTGKKKDDDEEEGWTVVKRQLDRLAKARRGFLKSLEPWEQAQQNNRL